MNSSARRRNTAFAKLVAAAAMLEEAGIGSAGGDGRSAYTTDQHYDKASKPSSRDGMLIATCASRRLSSLCMRVYYMC